MFYEIDLPLRTVESIKTKLYQLTGKRLDSPLNAIRYADLITKLGKIDEELDGLVNSIKEKQ